MNRNQNVLVVGSGGREAAMILALKNSPSFSGKIFNWPGSDALTSSRVKNSWAQTLVLKGEVIAPTQPIGVRHEMIDAAIAEHAIELVIIGPEAYLEEGLSDFLREKRRRVFAPSQAAARLETSKIYAKEVMREAGVKTARSFVVDSVDSTLKAAAHFRPPYVLKADGLAAGKGVFIESSIDTLRAAAVQLFEKKIFGSAGERALLEEYTSGQELSHLIFTNGTSFKSMPAARDHKRLKDGDLGPNTGGMGVVAPIKLSSDLLEEIETNVVRPVLKEIQRRSLLYRGVLYFGLMLTAEGPSVLEFNTRFGDPEAQALLPLIVPETDFFQTASKLADGELADVRFDQQKKVACVVIAAEGYPDNAVKGIPIPGISTDNPNLLQKNNYLIHAATQIQDVAGREMFVTGGGRVLNSIAIAQSHDEALKAAYKLADEVLWPGSQIRRDIGKSVTN